MCIEDTPAAARGLSFVRQATMQILDAADPRPAWAPGRGAAQGSNGSPT